MSCRSGAQPNTRDVLFHIHPSVVLVNHMGSTQEPVVLHRKHQYHRTRQMMERDGRASNVHDSIASIPVRHANPVQLFSSLISLFERCHCRKRDCSLHPFFLAGNFFLFFLLWEGVELNYLLSLHSGRNRNESCAFRKVQELVLCNSIVRLQSQYWLFSD
jgi:hypothetical protein